ncbi:MAG: MBL fold metallo-hydrolase [Flavobacteriales bacterium]|jgi:phosphoribosyl 1,2-cyclic phosphate phosphodiesterase|nr:MBL fold metallo-hydrolase [Flavobacteriales bacterium]
MPAVSLEFLGTGTSQGVPVVGCACAVCRSTDARDRRLRASALLRVDGRALLIDAGPDLRQQLLRARVDHLDAVLLTHEHMDHIGGIDDLRALNYRMKRPMDIHASTHTLSALQSTFAYAFAADRYPGVPELHLHPITGRAFEAGGVAIEKIEVMHYRMPVLGFRIGGLAYITDAKTIDAEEVERLRGIDTLVLNALRIEEHVSHLNLKEALAMVERIAPKRAYFTHISHLLGRHDDVSRGLPGNVALAYDGLRVDVEA